MLKNGTKIRVIKIDPLEMVGPADVEIPEDHSCDELIGLEGVILHDQFSDDEDRQEAADHGEGSVWICKIEGLPSWIPADETLTFTEIEIEKINEN